MDFNTSPEPPEPPEPLAPHLPVGCVRADVCVCVYEYL